MECARDELQKLSVSEQEGKRKDEVISALRKEIAEYKKCTQSGDMKYYIARCHVLQYCILPVCFVRYASLEEKLSTSESHLRERLKEVQMLQLEVLIPAL